MRPSQIKKFGLPNKIALALPFFYIFVLMRRIAGLGIFILASTIAFTQTVVVKGIVQSEGTGLKGATVSVGSAKSMTDSIGFFRLQLNPGKFTLHVSMIGYETHHETIAILNEEKLLQIELQPFASSLGEV